MIQKRRKRKRIKRGGKTFYQEYNFEILVLGLFTLGFFLLWEKWNIKALAWGFVTQIVQSVVIFIRDISIRI
ncbi:MAG: hypothetical protein QF852_02870, partial [Candidatus Marinimicrobia bacterium]|nr:hypothetical protein [Candidatus Neomarinimicrobiota bacterium]